MNRMLFAIAVLLLSLSLCACGTETVEITMDNWDTYFEFRTVYSWADDNAFGEPGTSLEYPMVLCVKEEYEDCIVLDEVDLAIECSWVENERYVSIDWEDQSIEWGSVVNSRGVQTRINQVTDIQYWESYENACVAVYLRDIGLSLDTVMWDSDGNMYAECMENPSILRIKGSITIKK